ncbi:sensor histidine kinase [Corynebacterium epidermidicanis]|uniref:Signal transduction histidine kinase n=1 Tax=Corynebacterium epidermidicanis TaxID=1050174 RepID=A0A0G3GQI0_9CORY|nr:sensor histidine kinase [Corynebacterium epidermidicanis]AKK03399.1 signal transduction histidine kinase [Corynebacterium epidermidicanis]
MTELLPWEDPKRETPRAPNPQVIANMWQWLHLVLGVLVFALWVLAIVEKHTLIALAAGIAFCAVFAIGEWALAGTRGRRWALIWLGFLATSFLIFVLANPAAAYLAFPLFFVVLHVCGGWRAGAWIACFIAIAVMGQAWHGGLQLGAVIGPVIAGVVVWLLGSGFQLLIEETRAREQAMADLIAARAEATRLARQAGEASERSRLAADIHDTVAQGLSSIQLLLHSAEQRTQDPDLKATLHLARQTAKDNLQETRRIIAALQPAPLTGASLPVALARVASTTPMGSAVDFHIDGTPRPLDDATEASIVRLAQSMLSNVVRHAHATQAAVTLTYGDNEVALDVVDNGVGFDPATIGNSFGLHAASQRVAELGGKLIIESTTEGTTGTGIRIELPTKEQQ